MPIKEALDSLNRAIQDISSKPDPIINTDALSEKIDEFSDFPIDDFLKVKTVNDFKKVEYTEDEISAIQKKLVLISNIKGFIADYNEFIHKDYTYMKNSLDWLDDHPLFFSVDDKSPLKEIHVDCKPFILELSNILDSEQRRILKGKLQQYKRKYISLYYVKHTKTIGEGIDWDKLEKISRSKELKKLRDLKAIRIINPLHLNKLDERIISLSKARCTNLTEDSLKDSYLCAWCRFPETLKDITDINSEIDRIQELVAVISEEWTNTVFNEIETYSRNSHIPRIIDKPFA